MLVNKPRAVFNYDEYTERLLGQYQQQLADWEKVFEADHKHLPRQEFVELRDRDPIMMAILDVVAKIYEQAIPISITIVDDAPTKAPSNITTPKGGFKH